MATSGAAGWTGRIGWPPAWVWLAFVWLGQAPLWYYIIFVPAPSDPAASAACDRAVAAMLDSRDPVELQRADMLIRHLDCGVRKRLPRLEP